MSRWRRMRPLPLIAGGIITVVLAIWLLPKPETATGPLNPPAVTPTEDLPTAQPALPAPVLPAPAPPVPEQPTEVPVDAPASVVPDGPHPVSSRGFRSAMRTRYDAIIACYDQWAADTPDLPERQVIRFYIEPGDEISRVDRVEMMDSPVDNGPMEACVLDVMIEAEFEPSDALTVYTFPFRFGEAPDK